MNLVYSSSTRLRIVAIAVLVAAVREIARRYGWDVSDDVYLTIEASLLALAGLDTVRPLGLKPAKVASVVGEVVSDTLVGPTEKLSDPPAAIVVDLDPPK